MKLFKTLTLLSFAALSFNAKTQTCLTAWETKVPITIDNSAGDELTDYQILLTLDTETPILLGQMEADGRDIRFVVDGCCDPLCYYIEEGINTASTKIWVNVPLIEAGEMQTIYAFFGNPAADPTSDPECTFAFHEGFDDDDTNFEYACGTFSDETVFDGDLNLAWPSNAMLGSNTTFDFEEIYTAEAMVNGATGNWPAIYWAKETSEKNYGLMAASGQARISLTGGGSGWCSGHNWASPLIGYGSTVGVWSFTWKATGDLFGDFPTIGTISTTDALYAKDEDLRLMIGGISSGSGGMNIDWIRVRKYAEFPPTYTIEAPVSFEPAPPIDLVDELTGCGSVNLDAGPGFDAYEWSTGGIEQTETVLVSDMYYITVTDSEGCYQLDSIDVAIGEIYSLTETIDVCMGSSYTFPDGTVAMDISGAISHTSNLSTEGFGCDSTIVSTVNVYPFSPELDLGEDITACEDSLFLDAGAGFSAYNWSDGATTQFDTITVSGTYTVEVIDDNGCTQIDEVVIEFVAIDNEVTQAGTTFTANESDATAYQWLDCLNDYSPILGEINMDFVATIDGSYAVQIVKDGCIDTSACNAIFGISVAENELANLFAIYPNPTSGALNLNFSKDLGSVVVKVMNVEGKIIQTLKSSDSQLSFMLSGADGLYFVEVVSNKGSQIIKVIKE